jgi:choice-of-anchor A domain-containing protein
LRTRRRSLARRCAAVTAAIAAAALAATGVHYTANAAVVSMNPLDGTEGFNVFVRGDVALSSIEMEGPLALGGDLSVLDGVYNIDIHGHASYIVDGDALPTSLVVGGRADWAASDANGIVRVLSSSYAKIGDLTGIFVRNTDQNNASVNTRILPADDYESSPRIELTVQQPIQSVGPVQVFDFDARFAEFEARAALLAGCENTVTMRDPSGASIAPGEVADGQQVRISLEPGQTNVLHLTATDLNNMGDFVFENQPDANAPLLINVDTSDVGGTFDWDVASQAGISGVQAPYLLWVFNDTEQLHITGGDTVEGAIYIPGGDYINTSPTNVEGQIVARNAELGRPGENGGEVHHFPFAAEITCESDTPVPAPTTDGPTTDVPTNDGPTTEAPTNAETTGSSHGGSHHLPRTGAPLGPVLALAGGLMAAGFIALRVRARRTA